MVKVKKKKKANNRSLSKLPQDFYIVDKIRNIRRSSTTGKLEFLVKWKNFSENNNTWDPEKNFSQYSHLIEEFKKKHVCINKQNLNNKYKKNITNVVLDKTRFFTQSQKNIMWQRYFGQTFKAVCPVCNVQSIDCHNFIGGHIVPHSCGGRTNIDNGMPICNPCNIKMGDKNLIEFKRMVYPNSKPIFLRDGLPYIDTFSNDTNSSNILSYIFSFSSVKSILNKFKLNNLNLFKKF